MKLKNKIFLILVIFFIVLLGMITNSYCALEIEMSDGEKVTFENPPNDGNPDFFVYHFSSESSGNGYMFLTYDSISYNFGYYDGVFICFDNTGKLFEGIKVYKIYSSNLNGYFEPSYDTASVGFPSSSIRSFYSTKDIYECYQNDNFKYVLGSQILFQGAPLPIPMVIPMEVSKVEELPTLIIQIVEMIIPAFLIIFGTLLVLYLIKSKNLLQL